MYSFIFWFFYKYFEWRIYTRSPLLGYCMVAAAISIHLFLIYSVVYYLTGYDIAAFSNAYGYDKLMMLPYALLLFFIIQYFYYRKKTQHILDKYGDRPLFTIKNIALVLLIMVIPLVLVILFDNAAMREPPTHNVQMPPQM